MANLIGTKPNQVPTNGSLGTMAFQDADNVSDVTFIDTVGAENLSLTAIAQTKAESAVDVFVYDTSKDSDGGAWRQRTQHTSWYNEPLNTATRGSRKEFPAVAVIVAEATKVTIYDGDDPSLPMWMVFNVGGMAWASNNLLAQSGATATWSLSAINGVIVFAPNSTYRMRVTNFISEYSYVMSDAGGRVYNGSLSERNSGKGHTDNANIGTTVDGVFNDVAMTVLPDAPIDPATGLPIPTIAVATNGGVSVIKDDGTVVDITHWGGSSYSLSKNISFLGESIIFDMDANSQRELLKVAIPESNIVLSQSNHPVLTTATSRPSALYIYSPVALMSESTICSDKIVATLGAKGLAQAVDSVDYTTTLGNIITSTYNTGWMNGDIKLATLSDTDDTDLVGTELVTNGDFTGWTSDDTNVLNVEADGTVTVNDGNGTSTVYLDSPPIAVTAGKHYTITIEGSGAGTGIGVYSVSSGGIGYSYARTVNFVATGSSETLRIFRYINHVGTGTLTGISMRESEPDRSVNGNGLQVFGTVQKNPVATGADLVAYSGFSSTNYLEQPYNSDLDFGTGDFCVMGWFKDGSGSGRYVVDFAAESGADRSYFIVNRSQGAAYVPFGELSGLPLSLNTWQLIGLKRKNGALFVIIDGKQYLVNSGYNTNFGCISSSVKTHVNSRYTKSEAHANVALFRISATAPTAEQIKKIYEDEKVLFQENAQATLHGTSDAVTALAYDDTTELLHVGTSAGRSVFQGLKRVDNTTDAVGVAISASNGLVVEE
jgi:trimeric autotransporter adhesin